MLVKIMKICLHASVYNERVFSQLGILRCPTNSTKNVMQQYFNKLNFLGEKKVANFSQEEKASKGGGSENENHRRCPT